MINVIFFIIVNVLILMLVIAFYTVVERKVMAAVQRRVGPGFYSKTYGVFQGIFDGISLLLTSITMPIRSKFFLFISAPVFSFTCCVIPWFFLPISNKVPFLYTEFSVLFVLAFISMSSVPILIAGFASGNEYAYLGSFRAICAVLSYELLVSFIIVILCFFVKSYDIFDLVYFQNYSGWFIFYVPQLAVIYYILILIETNRAPFDLAESESELVAGFHVEYSGFLFALFFLTEYSFMLLGGVLFVIFFLGGWDTGSFLNMVLFYCKIIGVCVSFIIVRAVFPRVRIDQLIIFSWKKLLLYVIITIIYIVFISLYMQI